MNPEKLNKYLYIEQTPTWVVRFVYLVSILAWILVLYGYIGVMEYDPVYRWLVGPLLLFFTIYYLVSYGENLFYKKFDLKKHQELLESFWNDTKADPSVDIFLPICGEDIEVLRNTWEYVSKIQYQNKKIYVLDDSREFCDQHQSLAENYGFTYLSRANKGWMNKAGNLKYAYEKTSGEFIIIFDADFAPRHDFITELLPYMDNSQIGIVQSPQYFEVTKDVHSRSALEYGAARVQESFYRYIQVARSRFNATVCCGSNAIYRRAALDDIGGPSLVEHSEDAQTGFAMVTHGWKVIYVPIILSLGLCPSDLHLYFHQQHRWASGSITLCLSEEFWDAPVDWKTKISYCVGFLFYLSQPVALIVSFQLFYFLFVYNGYINLENGILFYPALIWGYYVYFFFSTSRFRPGVFLTSTVQMYSYSHAVVTSFLNRTVKWLPTNAKHIGVSNAFRQVTYSVYVYIFLYAVAVAVAFRMKYIHLLNYNYYSLQIWILYNMFLSAATLYFLYRTIEKARYSQIIDGNITQASFIACLVANNKRYRNLPGS